MLSDGGRLVYSTCTFAPEEDAGYIGAYPPGVRENGGQYTHALPWFMRALLQQGETERAWQLLEEILPYAHSDTPEKARHYRAEPYVLAADVSANPDHYGEAMWSWYTGSAGWFFRIVLEDLLGIRLQDGRLVVEPRLPAGWEGYEAEICGRKVRVRHGRVTIS